MTPAGALGRVYRSGDVIVRQGDVGDAMYLVQEGEVEIVVEDGGVETVLRIAGRHELLGEMAVFDRQVRSATIRAHGTARVLTLDKRNVMRRMNEDPTLAFRIVESMARRVRDLSGRVVALQAELRGEGPGR